MIGLVTKLSTDELRCIAQLIDKDARFAFSLTCRAARAVVTDTLTTTYNSVVTSIALFKWAIEMGASKKTLLTVVFQFGTVEMLKYAHKHGCTWDDQTIYSAVKSERIEMVRYAHKHGCPWHANTLAAAVPNIKMMRFVLRRGCPMNEIACARAALIGNLEALQCARKHGCPWDTTTCCYAVIHGAGHLNILMYTYTDTRIFKNRAIWRLAVNHGHTHILEWMRANGLQPAELNFN